MENSIERVMYIASESDIQRIVTKAISDVMDGRFANEPKTEEMDKLLTSNEAVSFLRCSKPTLHRWKKEGIVPFVRIGTNIRYKESDLKKLIEK